MSRKNNRLLLCLLLLTSFSLLFALIPALAIDADGTSNSLVTDDDLLTPTLSMIPLLYLVNRFAPIQLASPWLLSFLLILPPITTI
ncbi:MAG TPA: hypothetical protein VK206_07550 [Anaerolineales bacterium]|nr:hypothetical protein [Anaerolineales bacterium]